MLVLRWRGVRVRMSASPARERRKSSAAHTQARRVFKALCRRERELLGDSLVHGTFDASIYVDLIGAEPVDGLGRALGSLWYEWEISR